MVTLRLVSPGPVAQPKPLPSIKPTKYWWSGSSSSSSSPSSLWTVAFDPPRLITSGLSTVPLVATALPSASSAST